MAAIPQIERLIEPALNVLGFGLVRARLTGRNPPTLQVMIERVAPNGGIGGGIGDGGITVDDCAEVSRTLSAILDVENPIEGGYQLEVSSPGIDRPLVRLEDYRRFAGHEAKIEMHGMIGGRKRFQGTLAGVDGDRVKIDLKGEGGLSELPFDGIAAAKLVMTEALIAQTLKSRGGEPQRPEA
ncbi:MAG: ribosome maturation factor RimP [Proteobacteria bacterium]|nr:ribosome maturation factor RimP [Pseudomonadota bacterium]